ncbi:RagB/SusD family nutrient uptake outer membrane protein [Chitinophagaceae bacterium LB-8]|uniref:RagB/SusD family nutrient uptake outer membrane protein n=1 Tax=Paraflavisolibacter caeni TaxID=2982496 RepID=A0A9X2XVM4_9BACT|nr:RagB/SusD family nutrient uptake outer membrane protein [Paraflavisolibacter caeni]MCU7549417.1 RagB/SusD family nutrient uptake outer membrane protein [Paraflavisolibacter caeni]
MTKIKNKFMNRSWLLLLATGLLLILGSCNKQLDIQSSRQADEAGHWTSYEDARSGLIGLYGLFRAAVADNNAHWLLGELRSGDFKSVSRPDLKAIIDGNLNASFPAIQSVTNWRRFYAVVNACNLFIERVKECEADQRYTESYYKLDIAQARTLRAFVYFYMVRIWGDVPLITRSQDGTFEQLPRTKQDAVLSFVEQELKEAAPYLPYLYSGNDPEQKFPNNYYGNNSAYWLNMPMTRLGAYALLAHVAAWQGRYVDVAIYTDFIINNASKSNLKLLSSDEVVNSLFDASNTTLGYNQLLGFSFLKTKGETTTEGHIEELTLANTTLYAMSKQMPDIYVPKDVISVIFPKTNGNDDRFGVDTTTFLKLPTTRYFENYSSAVPVFKKVRVVDGSAGNRGKFAVFNSSIVFTRLEEIRLLRAEALAVLGQTNDAFTELNVIRGQRKITSVSPASGADPIDEIFAERRRELMGEGWRWYDLIRYNRIKHNNAAFNELIDQGGIYWPIAQDVLNRNPKLVQNAYWQ